MKHIIILNIVLNVATILVLLWHVYQPSIKIERTFWRKVPFELTLMLWNKQRTHGQGLYRFRWRNPDHIEDYPPKGTRGKL